ncbi:MAG: alpha/beta hydrolase [Actinomycetota bacterium]
MSPSVPKAIVVLVLFAVLVASCSNGSDPQPDGQQTEEPPPAGVRVKEGVGYRSAGGVSLELDVYMPEKPGPYPGLIYIHGGGFFTGDKCTGTRSIGSRYAREGFVVYMINYRLAPALDEDDDGRVSCSDGTSSDIDALRPFHYPAPLEDATAAAEWVRAYGRRYKTDVSRIGALGTSAGGTLAYMLGNAGLVDAVVGWSGPTMLGECSTYTCSVHENYLGCPEASCPERWTAASPLPDVSRRTVPTGIYNSSDEVIDKGQAEDLAAALEEAGVRHATTIVPGRRHATAYGNYVLPNGEPVWEDTSRFLKDNLGPAE